MIPKKTIESQNQSQYDDYLKKGPVPFGPWTSACFRDDHKRLAFQLARYKFCAKMLTGKKDVLEIGCGDGPGIPIVLQAVGSLCAVDVEPVVIEDNIQRFSKEGMGQCQFILHDMTKDPLPKRFDAAYALDVLEHIPPALEGHFMRNLCASLKSQAVCILGTPNTSAQAHASLPSRQGHVNLKSEENLRALLAEHFQNIFIFSMNDEVVHTGFYPMAHYLLGVGVGIKKH